MLPALSKDDVLMPEINVHPEIAATLGTVAGGGGIGMWIKERRKTKKDVAQFALEMIQNQALRIDKLVDQVSGLEVRAQVAEGMNRRLEQENIQLKVQLVAEQAENARLKTALQGVDRTN